MNEFQKSKVLNSEKPFPGCMGRMVNLFDLNAGMSGNKLLTEKAHRDGSPHSRGRLDSTKVSGFIGDHVEDKIVAYELKRSPNKKSNGTPMKMLIAQEMSKEPGSRRKPPSVVARLMGLDALPAQQPIFIAEGCPPEGYLEIDSAMPGQVLRHQQEQNGFQEKQIHHEIYPSQAYSQGSPEYKDVYEVWHQSSKSGHTKDQVRFKGRCNEDTSEKKMALVRQKFIEAKRLATDEKLRQSKEFQDALEVLSSNRDLFLKFLQEPNSLLSKNLYELQSIPPHPETKRITVLKPSKAVETQSGKPKKKQQQGPEADGFNGTKPFWSTTNGHHRVDHPSNQPTRIVVLKPSPGKGHDIKAVTSSPTSSPKLLQCRDIQEFEMDGIKGSRDIAKEITRQMRENLSSNRRDDLLLSSALSNGYVGDESSFNKSDCEYAEEGNLSDSESLTPTSRHSWDYVNRYSAFSSSSFSRASYSPDSSVSREAKKRLSERWALMASNGSGQEPRQVSRSSSTLGEMLALPETKKTVKSGERDEDSLPNISCSRSCGGEQELGLTSSCLSSNGSKDEHLEDSPKNLSRSKSVPVSSTAYEKVELNIGTSDSSSKSVVSKEVPKPKGGKSSLKVKVSSLFFSRNKKQSKEKPCSSSLAGNGGSQSKISNTVESSEKVESQVENRTADISDCVTGGGQVLDQGKSPCKSSDLASFQGIVPLARSEAPEHSSENQDQPSPISVLEVPFEDEITSPESSRKIALEPSLHHRLLKTSEATARSPLIESVTRSLSWDDDTLEAPVLSKPESSPLSLPKTQQKEQEWFFFVQMLLSAAGLDHERSDTISRKLYAPGTPLDPLLLDKCASWGDEELVNQAKCRQLRSERKLLFDCVNAALTEMVASVTDLRPWVVTPRKTILPGVPVSDGVWARLKECFPDEGKNCYGETDHSLIVERVVRHEVEGREWVEHMRMEIDEIGEKLEREILAELLSEAVAELACGF
ncbi:hypothetical protein H6P81_013839 [Aristolochia fimbriata]|uniref:DUF4378 domain-containing protein n=1 Tax=Aristolochia fimbriata TaxID=158543 RepID=A0AAV7EH19_ARIFI|nr:hypothetical protein H6P81_013839 [Aristolochia fimbriata]